MRVVNNTGLCWLVVMAAPNGHSHCQQLLLGTSEAVPIVNGELLVGQWQHLFLVELDRARERKIVVQLVRE